MKGLNRDLIFPPELQRAIESPTQITRELTCSEVLHRLLMLRIRMVQQLLATPADQVESTWEFQTGIPMVNSIIATVGYDQTLLLAVGGAVFYPSKVRGSVEDIVRARLRPGMIREANNLEFKYTLDCMGLDSSEVTPSDMPPVEPGSDQGGEENHNDADDE